MSTSPRRRHIHELIKARAAGESLTPPEVRRLHRHEQLVQRLLVRIMKLRPDWLPFGFDRPHRSAFDTFVVAAKRRLRKRSAARLRTDLRVLLVMLRFHEEGLFSAAGQFYREGRAHRDRGKASGRARATHAAAFVADIDELMARSTTLRTPKAAVRYWRNRQNPTWTLGLTETQQDQRLESDLKRYRRNKEPKKK